MTICTIPAQKDNLSFVVFPAKCVLFSVKVGIISIFAIETGHAFVSLKPICIPQFHTTVNLTANFSKKFYHSSS